MNLRAMQYLVTLADVRHFSKAAERCHVSQPTLSTQIRKLEEELDVQLVERSPRRVMLTEVGEEVVERARALLAEVGAIKAIARRSRDPHSGTLRLGIFPTLAPYYLPHVVPELRRRFPRLTLRLFEEPFVLALNDQHPLAAQKVITMEQLEDQELLLLEDGHCLRDHALEVCQLVGAHEKLDFHATSMETLRQMVAAGTGITLLPVLAIKPPVAHTENLAIRRFDPPAPSRRIALVWRKSSALTAFLEELAEVLGGIGPELLTA